MTGASKRRTNNREFMKKALIYSVLAIVAATSVSTAEAKPRWWKRDRDRHEHRGHHHSHKTRTIYVIEKDRPVRRVVYVHPSGYYYHIVRGRPVRIRDRYYTSYPSRYYYPDGRRRIGVSLSF